MTPRKKFHIILESINETDYILITHIILPIKYTHTRTKNAWWGFILHTMAMFTLPVKTKECIEKLQCIILHNCYFTFMKIWGMVVMMKDWWEIPAKQHYKDLLILPLHKFTNNTPLMGKVLWLSKIHFTLFTIHYLIQLFMFYMWY